MIGRQNKLLSFLFKGFHGRAKLSSKDLVLALRRGSVKGNTGWKGAWKQKGGSGGHSQARALTSSC